MTPNGSHSRLAERSSRSTNPADLEDNHHQKNPARNRMSSMFDAATARAERLKRKKFSSLTTSEKIYLIANRLHATKAYTFFYLFMILLNTILLVLVAVDNDLAHEPLFLVCEVLITLCLLFEICLKLATQQKSYWKRPSNWFDFFVLILCFVSIVLFAEFAPNMNRDSTAETADGLLLASLLALRYITQLLRLIALLKQKKQLDIIRSGMNHQLIDDIDFSTFDPDIDYEFLKPSKTAPLCLPEVKLKAGLGSDSDSNIKVEESNTRHVIDLDETIDEFEAISPSSSSDEIPLTDSSRDNQLQLS